MDFSKRYDNPSPEASANLCSRLLYCWLFPLFKYGYRHNIEIEHLYNTSENDLSGPLTSTLNRYWNEEQLKAKARNASPKLQRALIKTFIKPYALFGVEIFLIWVVLRLLQPVLLAYLVKYFESPRTKTVVEGWLSAVLLIVLSFVIILLGHHAKLGQLRVAMQSRVAVCSLIYRKMLRLDKAVGAQTAIGKVVNLVSNDVARFDQLLPYLHFIWVAPVQAITVLCIMHNSISYAVYPALLLLLIQTGPYQYFISKLTGKLRFKIANRTDHRVQLMNEIILGVQVIKMYAWEKPFEAFVTYARKLEISTITVTSRLRGLQVVITFFTQRLLLFVTIITYVLLEHRLEGAIVFSVAQLLQTVQTCAMVIYPLASSLYAELQTSLRRIEEFLLQDEKSVMSIATNDCMSNHKSSNIAGSINIENASVGWEPNNNISTLSNINLQLESGILCAIVGQVGAGKSSFLQLLLRELPLKCGTLNVTGTISYASQEPWLFASTLRNNILFGLPYIKDKYENILKICALKRDIKLLPYGDDTLVGERGVSLSGGQRARINLARAVYREADIYLFDDPLSAVDTHVSKHLLEECFLKYLRNKTVILVTNQMQLLKHVDQIVIINNGQVENVGPYSDVLSKRLPYLRCQEQLQAAIENTPEENGSERLSISNASETSENEKQSQETQELIQKGTVSPSLYTKYFKSGGSILVLIITAVLFIITQILCNTSDIWLQQWTNAEQERRANEFIFNGTFGSGSHIAINATNHVENTTDENVATFNLKKLEIHAVNQLDNMTYSHSNRTIKEFQYTYMYIYTGIILATITIDVLRTMVFFKICMNASMGLHNDMFRNILKAPMRFFETNPSGRILNRFSKDVGAVDEVLPKALMEMFQIYLIILGVVIMVLIVTPWMVIPCAIIMVLCLGIKNIYLASSQNLKRLEAITRAPAFSHVSASLSGLTTIRACGAEPILIKEFDSLQDLHSQSWFLYVATTEAFAFYLDAMVVIFFAVLSIQFIIFDDGTTLSGDVGHVLYQSLALMGLLQYGMKQTAEVANQMTSVERIMEYTCVQTEGPFDSIPSKKPHRDWPQNGEIVFKNVSLNYAAEDGPVLHNLNICIKAGEKVGIVGRTGAGKSSIIAALFKLAPTEGSILIDDLETADMGLHDLRSKISIIPQEPILFTASVKQNLDPFGKCDDLTLWKALEDVELKDAIQDLNQQVHHGGSNYSTGQRQLVCLARAIISNNKILIMDEATANVDIQTDSLIQTTIRHKFKDCTVLTIAHRLNTVMDSDKILVMDEGHIVEFGHPHVLLQDYNGYFSSMLKKAGEHTNMQLRNIAQTCYQNMFQHEEQKSNEYHNKDEKITE